MVEGTPRPGALDDATMRRVGRAMLGRSRQLIPSLSAMMRSGCQDAERIQFHCSVALCNSLSTFLHKEDVLAMIQASARARSPFRARACGV